MTYDILIERLNLRELQVDDDFEDEDYVEEENAVLHGKRRATYSNQKTRYIYIK
jgi:hypothetical protein